MSKYLVRVNHVTKWRLLCVIDNSSWMSPLVKHESNNNKSNIFSYVVVGSTFTVKPEWIQAKNRPPFNQEGLILKFREL